MDPGGSDLERTTRNEMPYHPVGDMPEFLSGLSLMFRLHLSTLLIITLAAGLLLALNLRMRCGITENSHPPYLIAEDFTIGWPLESLRMVDWPTGRAYHWKIDGLLGNCTINISILIFISFLCEYRIRRRSVRNVVVRETNEDECGGAGGQ